MLLCFRCSSAQCRLHFIFSRWFAFCSRPETYLGSLVVLLELRTSDFTTALPGTCSLTGAQAVRPRSLHRDAPAATRSVPSEARSYSYSPFGILLDLRAWDFAKAPPDATRSLTGAQAVRLRSLHRDAPAVTRSLPSEALSYSYNPFVLFSIFSASLPHISATETLPSGCAPSAARSLHRGAHAMRRSLPSAAVWCSYNPGPRAECWPRRLIMYAQRLLLVVGGKRQDSLWQKLHLHQENTRIPYRKSYSSAKTKIPRPPRRLSQKASETPSRTFPKGFRDPLENGTIGNAKLLSGKRRYRERQVAIRKTALSGTPNCYRENGAIGKPSCSQEPLLSGKQCYRELHTAIGKTVLSGKAMLSGITRYRGIGQERLSGSRRTTRSYREENAIGIRGRLKLSGKTCYQEANLPTRKSLSKQVSTTFLIASLDRPPTAAKNFLIAALSGEYAARSERSFLIA